MLLVQLTAEPDCLECYASRECLQLNAAVAVTVVVVAAINRRFMNITNKLTDTLA